MDLMPGVAVKPGVRLHSAVSETEVLVVRAGAADVALTCAGLPMVTSDSTVAEAESLAGAADVLLGKRYVDDGTGLEVLCVKSGGGPLAVDGREMQLKAAKPLPSSD